jgi:hypothetical protein
MAYYPRLPQRRPTHEEEEEKQRPTLQHPVAVSDTNAALVSISGQNQSVDGLIHR